ncbi:hypothetical protein [Streptomyces sp. NBC_01180]|uniref:hypothetical protein n=1 Tax=Streptomyces sp. NBC_01180 TaxID=2903763 RepID=UPI00386B0D3B|nr:hypothetical protein OG708_17740 [Streptomyces sp. NBC_01180]
MSQPLPEPRTTSLDATAANAGSPPATPVPPTADNLTVTVSSHFKMIFLVIVGLTLMFWMAHFGLLFTSDPERPEIKDALETTKIAGFSSLGTILGLLGGAVSGKV